MVNVEGDIKKCCTCEKTIPETVISYEYEDTKNVICGMCIYALAMKLAARGIYYTWDDSLQEREEETDD